MSDIREKYNLNYDTQVGVDSDSFIYSIEKHLDKIITSNSVKKYIVKGSEPSTSQYLSLKFYNDSSYWWLILLINGRDNPCHKFNKGDTVFYPSQDDINAYTKSLSSYNTSSTSNGSVSGSFTF